LAGVTIAVAAAALRAFFAAFRVAASSSAASDPPGGMVDKGAEGVSATFGCEKCPLVLP